MKKSQIIIIAIAALAIIAVISNPSTEDHKQKVKSELKKYMDQSMALEKNNTDGFASGLASMLGAAFINNIVDNAIASDNYLLFSITKLSHKGEERNIGFGAFGNVWLGKSLQDALDKNEK